MLTEVSPTFWAVKVNGQVVATNLSSRMIAEHVVLGLPAEQRQAAQVYPVSNSGAQVLFG